MRNPYIVGPVVYQPHFYGRRALIEDLSNERNQFIYLVGNRRTGKTSILHLLEEETSHIPLYLSLQSTEADPVKMGVELTAEIRRKAKKIEFLRELSFDPESSIITIIEKLADITEERNISILMLWDEAEKLVDLDKNHLQGLRSVLQKPNRLRVVLAATKGLSKLHDLCRSWKTSPFLSGFDIRYVPLFNDEEAKQLILQRNNPEGMVQVNEALLVRIMEITGNHPYLIQRLCNRLFTSEGRLRNLTDRDRVVDDQLSAFFQSDYDTLSRSERAIIRKLVSEEFSVIDNLRASLRIKPEVMESYLYGLEQLGVIHWVDDRIKICNVFHKKWLSMGSAKETPNIVSDRASKEVAKTVARPKPGKEGYKNQQEKSIVEIEACIVRILGQSGRPQGAGFLVYQDHTKLSKIIITCAHIIENILRLDDKSQFLNTEIQIDFPLIQPGYKLTSRVVFQDASNDIALLNPVDPLPPAAQPASLKSYTDLWGHPFRALGFPEKYDSGVWTSGVLRDRIASGLIQMDGLNEIGYPVLPGFSGAPVWDEKLKAIVGMITHADITKGVRAAYMLPVGQLGMLLQSIQINDE